MKKKKKKPKEVKRTEKVAIDKEQRRGAQMEKTKDKKTKEKKGECTSGGGLGFG
jgi:hypothetical protein